MAISETNADQVCDQVGDHVCGLDSVMECWLHGSLWSLLGQGVCAPLDHPGKLRLYVRIVVK